MLDTNFYPLRVAAIRKAADKSVVVSLVPQTEDLTKFAYKAGQYLTLRFTLGGEEQRRAYSLCSSPDIDKILEIGVKQVEKGLVSTYINQQLKVGDIVEAMLPQGRFCADIDIHHKKDYFLFAGGSGVTPMFSILKSIAEAEPKSRVMLFYVNRNEDSIMFHTELEQLQNRYRDQVFVQHILSQPKTEKKGGFLGMFAKTITQWRGEIGRASRENVAKFVQKYRSEDARSAEYFLCGPEGMMQIVSETLLQLGVDKEHIRQEYFADTAPVQAMVSTATDGKTLIATLNKKQTTVALQANETILNALIRVKANPPFSCKTGACSTCMAKVITGEVKMGRCLALDESEVKDGYILTCTSTPISDVVEISYDV